MRDFQSINFLEDTVCHIHRACLNRRWQQDDELFAAIACSKITRPSEAVVQRYADLAQAGISSAMTISVVEKLEVVDIDKQDSKWAALSGETVPLSVKSQIKMSSVCETGQGILMGNARQFLIQNLSFSSVTRD